MTAKNVAGQKRMTAHIDRYSRRVRFRLRALTANVLCPIEKLLRHDLQLRQMRRTGVAASQNPDVGFALEDVTDRVV